MGCVIAFVGIPVWFICYDWIGLSTITSISIIISVLLLFALIMDISNVKDAKKKLEENKKCKAKLIDKKEIKGYRSKTTYTFELEIGYSKYTISKENFYKKIGLNDVIDVYPIYKDNKVIDFDYDLENQSKISFWFILITILSIAISIILILNDELDILESIGLIIGSILLGIFFLAVGIYSLKRYLDSNKDSLIPVNVKIVGFKIHRSYDSDIGGYIEKSPTAIYQAEINGEVHQFIGDKGYKKEDKARLLNTNVIAYYDKNTMEFFEQKNNKKDLALAIMMFIFIFLLLASLF